MLLHYRGKLEIQIFSKYSANMEENANKLHFTRLNFCYSSTNFDTFAVQIASFFPIQIANKIFHVTVFYLISFAINLWHRKFVTADVTAVFVNNQHGIQQRGQDFDKKFVFEGVRSKEVDRRISKVGDFLKCNLFAFSYTSDLIFLISQGSVATCLR